MKYHKQLLDLNRHTKVTMYLCSLGESAMYTFHEDSVFDGEIPEWMLRYIKSADTLLPFDLDGKAKHYFKWVLDDSHILVIMDEASHICQNTLMKYLLSLDRSGGEANDEADLSDKVERYKRQNKKLQDEIVSLKEQNDDQALRLKNTLSENLSLQKRLRSQSGGDDEGFLHHSCTDDEDGYQKNLSYVIKNLNNIITTSSAANVDIDVLSAIIPISSSRELERNSELVKNLIAKLIGMDRMGKLTSFQIKKLCEAFK